MVGITRIKVIFLFMFFFLSFCLSFFYLYLCIPSLPLPLSLSHHKNDLQTATHPNFNVSLAKMLSAPSYSKRGFANSIWGTHNPPALISYSPWS